MTKDDIIVSLQSTSSKYAYKGLTINPMGIVVHSTGANNPWARRYVNAPALLGPNPNNNWFGGSASNDVLPHGVIGKDINGKPVACQILPWNAKCQGCGSGSKGSYNASYIQFEICEDDLNNEEYLRSVMDVAADLCAYLMKMYPQITIDNVVSHKEAHARGYASNHGDPDHWLKKHGLDMDWFRYQVQSKLGSAVPPLYRVQVGAFQYRKNAEGLLKELQDKGYNAFIKEE